MKTPYSLIVITLAALLAQGCGNFAKDGTDGVAGATGSQGPQGNTGDTGAKGADGTVITVVQFCPNDTPSYPATFPETGLCIGGNVYAVYSANDGFLTMLTPGTYNSNAVGSACTFTLLPNCKLQ